MVVKLQWRDDPDAEAVLKFVAVEWVVKAISFDDIDWVASGTNCARLWNPINAEKVAEYHTAMTQGDVFPRIVVEASAKGFVILGGNQRSAAVKEFPAPWPTVEAYVVRPLTTAQRESCIRGLNSRHGWGSSKEERIEHAVYLVMKHGVATADAAKLMVVAESTINEHVRASTARSRLAQKGIDTSDMTNGALSVISKISDEKLMTKVAKVVLQHKPSKEQTDNVVKAILSAKSPAEAAKTINAFDGELAARVVNESPGNTKQLRRPRREKLFRGMESLSEFLERGNDGTGFSSLDELQCTPADTAKLLPLAQKIVLRFKAILGVK